jgi:hypothetical protein
VTASLILAVLAALAIWAGSLYVYPFGRCPRCNGAGIILHGKRRVKLCPRCEGRKRVQRPGSRTVHQLARTVRQGHNGAARYQQEDSHGDT